MQLCIQITGITDRNILTTLPVLVLYCPSRSITAGDLLTRNGTTLSTSGTLNFCLSLCTVGWVFRFSSSNRTVLLSHTVGVSGLSHTVGVFGLSHSDRTVFFTFLLPGCVSYFFATSFHFVFTLHRNTVPDISPVPLQVTTDLIWSIRYWKTYWGITSPKGIRWKQ
jgi:hypothetical protein